MKSEPHCSADCSHWDLAGNFFLQPSYVPLHIPQCQSWTCLQYCEQDKSYFLVNETVPLVFLVSEDIGTCGNNYDHAVLRTVFHSAFPTLFSTCLHIPLSLSFSFSLPSLFIFPFRGWRVLIHWGKLWFWIIPVAGPVVSCRETFRLHFTNTIQVDIRQGMRLYSRERQRDVGRSIFGAFVPVCVLLCWSYTPYNLIWGSFLFSVCLFQCLWAHRTNLRHCAGTRIPENELPFSI